MPNDDRVPARATVHLPGLSPGDEVNVVADDPYIASLIERDYLVPIEEAAA